jgi:hypothetical protein
MPLYEARLNFRPKGNPNPKMMNLSVIILSADSEAEARTFAEDYIKNDRWQNIYNIEVEAIQCISANGQKGVLAAYGLG